MATEAAGSVTHWIDDLKAGGEEAAALLWERYFHGLVHIARDRLRAAPRGKADEEDVAISAFHSLCRGAARGRFPELQDRNNLWKLLVTITAQKALDHRRREGRLKRGGRAGVAPGSLPGVDADRADALARVAGREPSPEFAAQMAEECRRLLDRLEDETLRRVASRKMEGHTNEEIARELGCGLRTVERKLAVIRMAWIDDASA
jgi:DNA-directed RNA polymerase specialized sigma24 family protein